MNWENENFGPGMWGGPRGRGRGGFGRGGRTKRGDMRPIILQALMEKPMHGYEIIRMMEEKTNGFWRPSPGSVYPTLQLLEEEDLVTSNEENGKKIYTITAEGKKEAEASPKRGPFGEGHGNHGDHAEARMLMGQFAFSFRNAISSEDKAKIKKAKNIVLEASKKLIALTMDDDSEE